MRMDMAESPRTPPRQSHRNRPHTPPAPLHGAFSDNYEPYPPRRSLRPTANPYSSSNAHGASLHGAIGASASSLSGQTISPPSPPRSPNFGRHHTPPPKSPGKVARLGASHLKTASAKWDAKSMLLTPVKTPGKGTPPHASNSRVLNFHPADPNHVMPHPRKIKKHGRGSSLEAFSSFEDGSSSIEVYNDWSNRMPEVDESEDNPFVDSPRRPQRSSARFQKTRPSKRDSEAAEMERRANNDEGVIYSFRGKRVFRPFVEESLSPADAASDPLIAQAGAAASRPLTRTAFKPKRLTFDGALQHTNQDADEVDEEAVTDVEDDHRYTIENNERNAASSSLDRTPRRAMSPSSSLKHQLEQPSVDPIPDAVAGDSHQDHGLRTTTTSVKFSTRGLRHGSSPFDDWPRTKATASRSSRKREAGSVSAGAGKRVKSDL